MIDQLGQKGSRQLQQGQWQEALATFDELLALDPENAQGYQKRAKAYQGLGDRQRELEDLTRSVALDGNEVALFNRGVCLLELGEVADGRKDLELFLRTGRNPQALNMARQLLGLPEPPAPEPSAPQRPAHTTLGVLAVVLLLALAGWWRWSHPPRPVAPPTEVRKAAERYHIEVAAHPLKIRVNERLDGTLDFTTSYTQTLGPDPSKLRGKLTREEGQQLLDYFRAQGMLGEYQTLPADQWGPFIVIRSGEINSRTFSTTEKLTQVCLEAPFLGPTVKRSLEIGTASLPR